MNRESCQTIAELLVEYADDELPAADAQRVAEHLAECTNCRAKLVALRQSLELAQTCWQQAAEQAPSPAEYRVQPPRRRIHIAVALAAFAAVVVVAVGLWLLSQGQPDSQPIAPHEIALQPTEELTQEDGNNAGRSEDIDVEVLNIEELIAREGRAARLAASAEMLAAQPGLEDYAQQAHEYLVEVYGDTTVVQGLVRPPL